MKVGGTAMLHVAKTLAAHDVQLKADLLLSFVHGEKSGRADIGVFILLDRGYTSDFSIMAEPTNPEHIYHKTKGEIYFDIKITGIRHISAIAIRRSGRKETKKVR